jgi:hypothetical protein
MFVGAVIPLAAFGASAAGDPRPVCSDARAVVTIVEKPPPTAADHNRQTEDWIAAIPAREAARRRAASGALSPLAIDGAGAILRKLSPEESRSFRVAFSADAVSARARMDQCRPPR